jgi:hypothetical protein
MSIPPPSGEPPQKIQFAAMLYLQANKQLRWATMTVGQAATEGHIFVEADFFCKLRECGRIQ